MDARTTTAPALARDLVLRPGRHRIRASLTAAPSTWSLAVFRSALPIGGLRLARSPRIKREDPTELALVVDIGPRARPMRDVCEWLWDALAAAELKPVLLTMARDRIHARPMLSAYPHRTKAA